jgi:hypothetical protein
MVLLLNNGVQFSQNHGVMLPYGNNNLQSMCHNMIQKTYKLYFGVMVMVLTVMTSEDSTKMEKWPIMLLVVMTKVFMLLTMTTVTKLV